MKSQGPMSDREILLRLCGSLTLCDHMGDVSGDVHEALNLAGVPKEKGEHDSWEEDVVDRIAQAGVTVTLYGTSLSIADDDE